MPRLHLYKPKRV